MRVSLVGCFISLVLNVSTPHSSDSSVSIFLLDDKNCRNASKGKSFESFSTKRSFGSRNVFVLKPTPYSSDTRIPIFPLRGKNCRNAFERWSKSFSVKKNHSRNDTHVPPLHQKITIQLTRNEVRVRFGSQWANSVGSPRVPPRRTVGVVLRAAAGRRRTEEAVRGDSGALGLARVAAPWSEVVRLESCVRPQSLVES